MEKPLHPGCQVKCREVMDHLITADGQGQRLDSTSEFNAVRLLLTLTSTVSVGLWM